MTVLCNDCLKKSNVKFHFVGGKCRFCNSYNTKRIVDEFLLDDALDELDAFKYEEEKENKAEERKDM